MAYTADYSIALGPAFASIADMRAQLVDTTGANSGGVIATTFINQGNGFYQWHYTAFPDGHRGGVKFYSAATPGTILAFASINPEELENTDVKTSTRGTDAGTVAALGARIVSGAYDYDDVMRLLAGTQGGLTSGALTGTFTIRDISDTKNLAIATVDANGNRTVIALDLTP